MCLLPLDCGTLNLSLESGETKTLTFTNYTAEVRCPFSIHAAPGEKVHLSFQYFDFQRDDYLYIEIDDDMTPSMNQTLRQMMRVLRYTGDNLPPNIISPGQSIYLIAVSDHSINGMGFSVDATSTDQECKYAPNKNTVSAFQISCKLLSFTLEDSSRNQKMINALP